MSKDNGCGCEGHEAKEEKQGCCGGHNHDANDGCGCSGHDHDIPLMKLEMDNGEVVNAQVLGVFECEDKEYIALLPEDSEEVYLYSYAEDGEDVQLGQIESDDEYEKVGEVFMKLITED